MREIYVNINKGSNPITNITIRRVEASTWWTLGFYKHHYLTSELNKSAKCFLFEWECQPIAFVAVLPQPINLYPYNCSISRLVILPDYQGLGLARKILDFVGGIVTNQGKGYNLYIKTAHDKMGKMLEYAPTWTPATHNKKERPDVGSKERYHNRLTRWSYSYRYCGEPIKGYEDILLPIEDIRRKWNNRHQLTLFDNI